MKHSVTYEKYLREKAIAQKKRLYTIDVDGRAIGAGRATFQFLESPELIEAVEKALGEVMRSLNAEVTND